MSLVYSFIPENAPGLSTRIQWGSSNGGSGQSANVFQVLEDPCKAAHHPRLQSHLQLKEQSRGAKEMPLLPCSGESFSTVKHCVCVCV